MSRVCEICGKKTGTGRLYARRGLAKSKGGVGVKVTGKTNRTFMPNLQRVKIKDETGTVRTARFCTKCLKTVLKRGTVTKVIAGARKALVQAPQTAP